MPFNFSTTKHKINPIRFNELIIGMKLKHIRLKNIHIITDIDEFKYMVKLKSSKRERYVKFQTLRHSYERA